MKLYRVLHSSWVYTKMDLIDVLAGDVLLGTGNYEMPKEYLAISDENEKFVEVITTDGLVGFSYRRNLVQIV